MSTMTDNQTDVIEHLDFDAPCSLQVVSYVLGFKTGESEPCKNPARWTMRCRACRAPGLACDEHMQVVRRLRNSVCGRCHAAAPGGVLWEFEPLGGVS